MTFLETNRRVQKVAIRGLPGDLHAAGIRAVPHGVGPRAFRKQRRSEVGQAKPSLMKRAQTRPNILTCPKGRARRTGGRIHCIGAGTNETLGTDASQPVRAAATARPRWTRSKDSTSLRIHLAYG